jgi:hypothetical protein
LKQKQELTTVGQMEMLVKGGAAGGKFIEKA